MRWYSELLWEFDVSGYQAKYMGISSLRYDLATARGLVELWSRLSIAIGCMLFDSAGRNNQQSFQKFETPGLKIL